jgi:hypothetical protein
MASFSDYLDTAYLPGQVYSAGLSDSTASPQDKMTYMTNKKFKFKPGSDAGEYFQQFLALQNNPEDSIDGWHPVTQRVYGCYVRLSTGKHVVY